MKKGFTLIELLAVIIVLAIVALIATPIVLDVIEDSKKSAAESEANLILSGLNSYCQNEDSKIQLGTLTEENRKCNHNLTYYIDEIIPNKSNDTTISNVKYENGRITGLTVESNGYIYVLDSTTNKLEELKDGYVGANPCTYNGNLVKGAEFVDGQYTYRYMQTGPSDEWHDITEDGWGVVLTDKNSTTAVTTELCSSINNKPIVSMSHMFSYAKASSIDVSSFDTSNVVSMSMMFKRTQATVITGLTNFNTSNVTAMIGMFDSSSATVLDLSSFDISNASVDYMFLAASATTIYAKDQATANRFMNEGSAAVIVLVK